MAPIVVGCDHAAYDLKVIIIKFLKEKGFEVIDVGCPDTNRVDYPDISATACAKVLELDTKGILICGSGIGIGIAANKINGIRCALVHDNFTAKMCRQHNDANMISFGARVTGDEVAKDMVNTFLSTDFEGGRHADRVAKIMKLQSGAAGA